jgi:hypothetical protein
MIEGGCDTGERKLVLNKIWNYFNINVSFLQNVCRLFLNYSIFSSSKNGIVQPKTRAVLSGIKVVDRHTFSA